MISRCALISKWEFSLTLTSFLLADYLSVKLASQKRVKIVKDCQYLNFTKNLLNPSFDLYYVVQKAKFLSDNNDLSS